MKEIATEDRIKQSAKKIFFYEGKVNAKMQEIADAAGINRALLHYYFRNRESLFELVLNEAIEDTFMQMFRILAGKEKFETRVTLAIHHIVDRLADYPFIENFIISEINKDPSKAANLLLIKSGKHLTKNLLVEIRTYIKRHKLPYLRPEDFILNMMALCAYPSSTKPIVQHIFGYSDKKYKAFLLSRKEMITRVLLSVK